MHAVMLVEDYLRPIESAQSLCGHSIQHHGRGLHIRGQNNNGFTVEVTWPHVNHQHNLQLPGLVGSDHHHRHPVNHIVPDDQSQH